jgi:ribosome maturation factor RimP
VHAGWWNAGTSKTGADLIQFRAIRTTVDIEEMGWAQPIFFSAGRLHDFGFTLKERVTRGATLGQLLEATIPPMGFELVDWELQPRARLVRVFIDKSDGSATKVSVEDCARVSNHLTHLFTVENVDYDRLEVSSPGLDRPLKKLHDFARFAGEEAQLHLHELTDGARRLRGVLRGVDGDNVLLETDKGTRTIPIGAIDKARLVPKIDWRKGK